MFGKTLTIQSSSGSNTRRKRRAITEDAFTLEPDTHYTVFLRGETADGEYQSTTWYVPIKLAADGLGIGVVVGIVIGILVVLVLAILLWYCLYYKRRNNKQGSHVVQNMPLTENFKSIKVPTIDPHVPILLNRFEDHVRQLKANSNYGFSQEYSIQ